MQDGSPAESIVSELRVEFFRRGINHKTAAAQSGLSTSGISRRLNGNVSPTLEDLDRLASVAGLEVVVGLRERAS